MVENGALKKILTVLAVEDDAFMGSLIGENLHSAGYEVISVESGTDGLSHAINNHPDLILLDVMLPDMSGLEVLKMLKENPLTKEIPIIIFSNLGGKEEIQNGLALGACEYLIKSLTLPSEVTEIIAKRISANAVAP